jgi:shikimate dehydrogenase
LQVPIHNQRLLILGAGGATRGILEPLLQEQPAQLLIANRTAEKASALAQQFSHLGELSACGLDEISGSFDLIINATAASLSNQLPPLPNAVLAQQGSCYDLAYAKQATPFVTWGIQQGATQSVDGIGMLVEQAAEAFFIWRGVRPQTEHVIKLLEQQRRSSQPQ